MGQTEKPEAAEPPSLSRSDTPAGGIAPAPPTPPSEEGKALLNGESDAPATPPPPSSSGGDDDDDGVPEKSSPSPSEETDHPDTPRPNLGAASSGAAAAKKKPKRKRVDRSIIPKPSVLRAKENRKMLQIHEPVDNEMKYIKLKAHHNHFAQFGYGLLLYFKTTVFLAVVAMLFVYSVLYGLVLNYTGEPIDANGDPIAFDFFLESTTLSNLGGTVGLGQVLFHVVAGIGFLGFLIWFHIIESKLKRELKQEYMGLADVSVWVRGLPEDATEAESIAEFFKPYGVSRVSVILDIPEALTTQQALDLAKDRVEEAELNENYGYGSEARTAQANAKVEALTARMETIRKPKNEPRPAHAFVTFRTTLGRDKCLREYSPAGNRPKFGDNKITVTQAPEPSDLMWENLHSGVGLGSRAFGLLGTKLISIISIAAVAGVLYAGGEYLRPALGDNAGEYAPWIQAVAIVLINAGTMAAQSNYVTKYRFMTFSKQESWLLLVLWLSEMLNLIVTPLALSVVLNLNNQAAWYFAYQPEMIAIVVVYSLSHLARLIPVRDWYYQKVRGRGVLTQKVLDYMYTPKEFHLAEPYSRLLTTTFLAWTFAPVMPVAAVAGFVGIGLAYWVDKILVTRVIQAPPVYDDAVAARFYTILPFALLSHYISTYYFFSGTFNDPAAPEAFALLLPSVVGTVVAAMATIVIVLRGVISRYLYVRNLRRSLADPFEEGTDVYVPGSFTPGEELTADLPISLCSEWADEEQLYNLDSGQQNAPQQQQQPQPQRQMHQRRISMPVNWQIIPWSQMAPSTRALMNSVLLPL